MDYFSSRIIGNKAVADTYFELSFYWKSKTAPRPGQFITVRGGTGTAPLLRRPFALSSYNDETKTAKLIYQKRGEATTLLAGKQVDETIDIIGPLGNSFPLPPRGRTPVLLAGGIGLGPLLYFAQTLKDSGSAPIMIFGARNRYLIPGDLLQNLEHTIELVYCTDDGSMGFKGTGIDYLKKNCPETPVFYTCGPHVMMKGVHALSAEKGAECWVSMEQIMACGVGACMGCAVETTGKEPFARVCTEGPIFNSSQIKW